MTVSKLQMRYSEIYFVIQLLDLFLNMKLITSKQYNEHMAIVVEATLNRVKFLEFQADPDYNKEF